MEAVQYIVFVQVLLVLFSTTATSTTTETTSSISTTASSTTTPQSVTETTSTSTTLTTILTSTTIATTSTDGITSTPIASTSTSTADSTTAKLTTTPRINTTSSMVEETSMSPQGTTQSKNPDSTTAVSNPTTTTTTTLTAITTATEQFLSSGQFPSSYSPSTENDTMTPTTQTTLTTGSMTSTSRPDQSTSYSTTGELTNSAGTTENVGMSTTTARRTEKSSVSTNSAGTTGHPGVLTTTARRTKTSSVSTTSAGTTAQTTKHAAESTSSEGTTANTQTEYKKQVINLRKDIDALKKKNSLLVYIIIGLAVALGIVFMTTIICCVYSSGRRGNALIDDGIDNDIKTSAYVRKRRPFGSLSNDVVNLFNRATRRFSARDSRENQLDSQPRYTFSNKLAEEDNEETEKVSEEKDTTKSVEQVEMKEVTEVQTEVVNETVVDGGISRDQKAFASLKNGDINSKLPKSQPCVVPIPTVPTGEAVVAMDNGEVDKETNDNTTDTVSKTDQSAEAADSDKTIAVTLRSDIDVENVISCRVDDRAMSEIDLSDQNEIPLPPPLAENGQQSEQGVDVAVTV